VPLIPWLSHVAAEPNLTTSLIRRSAKKPFSGTKRNTPIFAIFYLAPMETLFALRRPQRALNPARGSPEF
jgi:hypothetical protein